MVRGRPFRQRYGKDMAWQHAKPMVCICSGMISASRGFRRVRLSDRIKVMTAQGLHLFPFRTEKLNLATPMVLRKRESR